MGTASPMRRCAHHVGEVLIKALDGATLAGCISTFKKDNVALAGFFGPVLPLQQLDLERTLGGLILIARHALFVRVILSPGFNWRAIRHDEGRVVLVRIIDDVAVGLSKVNLRKFVVFNVSHT